MKWRYFNFHHSISHKLWLIKVVLIAQSLISWIQKMLRKAKKNRKQEEKNKKYQELFDKNDVNGDGVLSPPELRLFHRKYLPNHLTLTQNPCLNCWSQTLFQSPSEWHQHENVSSRDWWTYRNDWFQPRWWNIPRWVCYIFQKIKTY